MLLKFRNLFLFCVDAIYFCLQLHNSRPSLSFSCVLFMLTLLLGKVLRLLPNFIKCLIVAKNDAILLRTLSMLYPMKSPRYPPRFPIKFSVVYAGICLIYLKESILISKITSNHPSFHILFVTGQA